MPLVLNVMNGLFDLGHNELIRLINGPILYSPAAALAELLFHWCRLS